MNYFRINPDELINLDKVVMINFIDDDLTIEIIFERNTKYYQIQEQSNYENIKYQIEKKVL